VSDWEIVSDSKKTPSKSSSDWEMISNAPISRQQQPKEGLLTAEFRAPFRIKEDIVTRAVNFLKGLPKYYESAKTEVPGVLKTLRDNPSHALGQGVAGLAEQGQNVFNLPHDVINYATNRLNLFPQSINEKVQMARMPESEEQINKTFGQPQYPGEELLRGSARNSINALGTAGIAKTLNPLNLTSKSIANDVLKTEKEQIKSHSNRYNQIWNQAEKSGHNQVPIDEKLLSNNLSTIEKYKTPREYKSLKDFMDKPTLQNAQKAQSDMGIMHRKLEEKSRNSALTSEELSLYNAAKNSEKHIESNMFKNESGDINKSLQNKYKKLTKSYRENVVPYKYNSDIQAYKNKEMLPEELINSLSRGEFAAKKGWAHPALKIRNAIIPTAKGVGILGGANYLWNEMMGNKTLPETK
jgi:hypothetical protein